MKTLFAFVVTTFLCSSLAYAHDPKFHKKHFKHGEVADITANGFTMKTGKGTIPVTYGRDTVFEMGEKGDPAAAKDLKKDDKVAVSGTTLESGELVATEVLIDRDGASASRADATRPAASAK